MTNRHFLDSWVLQATWSIREAAYLVNEQDPLSSDIEISPHYASPVSKTYYWLKKEYDRDRLLMVAGTDDEPRFSPGTLIRRLVEKGRKISPRLLRANEKQGQVTGPHQINLEAVVVYRKAAHQLWSRHPNLTLDHAADVLTGLPSHMTSVALPTRSPVTIKNYLKGLSPNRAGRPRKSSTVMEEIDLAEIVKNMTRK